MHHHLIHLTNQLRRAQLLNEIEKPEFPKDSAEVRDWAVREYGGGWDY